MRKYGFNINLKNSPDDILVLGKEMLGKNFYQAIEVTYYENMSGADTHHYNNAIRSIVKTYNPEVFVHISGFNLAEENSVIRSAIFHEIKNCLEYTSQLGGHSVVIHSGNLSGGIHVPIVLEDGTLAPKTYYQKRAWQLSVQMMKHTCQLAKEYGITLYTENLAKEHLTQNSQHLKQYLSDVNCDNLAVVFDVGHCNYYPDLSIANELAAMKNLVGHLHIHDNDGIHDLHQPIGEGTVPFSDFVSTLNEIGYNGYYMMELNQCTPENLTLCRKILEELQS